MSASIVAQVADGVYRFGTRTVNWYAIVDGSDVTLVDAGFPGHRRFLATSLAAIGRRPEDVRAVVLTHSHVDHTGFAEALRRDHGTRVFVHDADAENGTRRFPPVHLYWRPTSWPLLWDGVGHGMATTPRIEHVEMFGDREELDVPGQPIVIHLGGHTPGSTAVDLPRQGAVCTGDNLVTLDPYTRRRGPRRMLCPVQHDADEAMRTLTRLRPLENRVLLPGHGEPWTGGVAQAVDRALALNERQHLTGPGAGPGAEPTARPME